ncbi:glycosidase [Candidatus Thiosymbion oneisti]|uniref:glycosidase n=1 Tax=Candidatus Thiosymbion oneisti TaxID=589554 RepID=UPI0013FDB996|nr:glycosidase [Candidatus Thiosymbion oneisti]
MNRDLPNGVMLNAYPDSIGGTLSDVVRMLEKPEFKDTFSLFYILPTFFNSDLDRGFSIIDYNLNPELVSRKHLDAFDKLNIRLKFDLVLNHLSVGSPQFQDMLKYGDESKYKDFFIDWNEFWRTHGELGAEGYVIPREDCLQMLFMRKPGLPILKVRFPDGTDRPYWNTFYQEVKHQRISPQDLAGIEGIGPDQAEEIAATVNAAIDARRAPAAIDLGRFSDYREDVISVVERKRSYLGQMDLNARSEGVWDFYDETLKKLRDYGATLIRLDAFAYLHKQPGMVNFFNKPGTWEYLERLKRIADKYGLVLLPEIHSEYGYGLHEEVAGNGFPIYDFFFPGLVIDALDRGKNEHLLRWIEELTQKGIKTVNMLGCHDGIPVLDLKGKDIGFSNEGLLSNEEIDAVIERILDRGGRVKNLYGPDGKKISYYQVNATFFSALGEDEQKLRLARAIQLFMPGIPQVWYLDLFAGKNDYEAADKGGTGGHKEINRTSLTMSDIEQGLAKPIVRDQLRLIRLRNISPAFNGKLEVMDTEAHRLHLKWENNGNTAILKADLRDYGFSVVHKDAAGEEEVLSYP